MNKEIKFRVYDPEGKRMSYNPISINFNSDNSINGSAVFLVGLDVFIIGRSSLIWMEYTGLKDKNGKEIYEGDIIALPDETYQTETDPSEQFSHVVPVVFQNGSFGLEITDQDGMLDKGFQAFPKIDSNLGTWEMEVIGNIYENPELLK